MLQQKIKDMGVSRKLLNWYARLAPARGVVAPPYKHVVQIGDPHLRRVSEAVPLDKVNTKEVQNVINKLDSVMTVYGSVGLSAPQIGVNMRIFVMRLTAAQLSTAKAQVIKSTGMTEIPFTVSEYLPNFTLNYKPHNLFPYLIVI